MHDAILPARWPGRSHDRTALRRLQAECDAARCTLSNSTQAVIKVRSLMDGPSFSSTVARSQFKSLSMGVVQTSIVPIEKVLFDGRVRKADVDDIVFIRGSTQMPLVRQRIEDFFGKAPYNPINAHEMVAHGAAVQAAVVYGDRSELADVGRIDVVPLSLKLEMAGAS